MTQPTATDDPIARFAELYARAAEQEPEPTAVALATADREGNPAVRMLLLKHFDDNGFVLYTNHESRKGRELHETPAPPCASSGSPWRPRSASRAP